MQINVLIKDAHENAVKKGFWEDWENCPSNLINSLINSRLMLIVGEIAEAMEALRKNNHDNFEEELADVAIRLADLCGGLGVDLDQEIRKKMDKNKDRPWKHGKAF